jgi:hypothetical protein
MLSVERVQASIARGSIILGGKSFMETESPAAGSLRSFDERGRAIALSDGEIRERNAFALAALDAIEQIGDQSQQRETLEYLMLVVDEDRLSDRRRFGS